METSETEFIQRGHHFLGLGLISQALDSFHSALSINNQSVEASYGIGLTYKQTHNFEQALIHYDQCLSIDPDYTIGYYAKGVILRQQNKFADAIIQYDTAIDLSLIHI